MVTKMFGLWPAICTRPIPNNREIVLTSVGEAITRLVIISWGAILSPKQHLRPGIAYRKSLGLMMINFLSWFPSSNIQMIQHLASLYRGPLPKEGLSACQQEQYWRPQHREPKGRGMAWEPTQHAPISHHWGNLRQLTQKNAPP